MKRNLLNTACKLEYNKDLITKYCCYKSPLLLYKPFELRPLSDMTCQLGIFFLSFALIHFFLIIVMKIFITKPQLKSYLQPTCCYKKSN